MRGRRSWRHAMLAGLPLLGAIGCAGPTGYRAADASANALLGIYAQGHRVQDLGYGDYAIVVRASWATAKTRVADVALLRSARLTRESGGTQFSVLHAASLPMERMVSAMTMMPTHYGFVAVPSGSTLVKERLGVLVIHVLPAGAAPGAGAVNARSVEDRLGSVLDAE
jgi:hypothetical protein